MKGFRFKSIKRALLVKIGLVAIVPLVAISLFNYVYYRTDSIASTADIQSLVNQNTATKIHLYVLAQQLLFMEYSKYSGVNFPKDEDPEKVKKKLKSILSAMNNISLFSHVFICNDEGTILVHDTVDKQSPTLVGEKMRYPFKFNSFFFSQHQRMRVNKLRLEGQYAVMPLAKSSFNNRLYLVGLTS